MSCLDHQTIITRTSFGLLRVDVSGIESAGRGSKRRSVKAVRRILDLRLTQTLYGRYHPKEIIIMLSSENPRSGVYRSLE